MRARLGDQAELSAAIFEEHEVFTEQPHPLRPPRFHLGHCADRLPVAAEQPPHRRGALDARQQVVFGGRQHQRATGSGVR
jgi:hypothetical protein